MADYANQLLMAPPIFFSTSGIPVIWYRISPSSLFKIMILKYTCLLLWYLETWFKKHLQSSVWNLYMIKFELKVWCCFFFNWNCILHFVKAIEKLSKTCLDIVSSCFQSVLLSDYRFQHIIFMWGIWKLLVFDNQSYISQVL